MKSLTTCLALISLPACTGSEPPPTDDLGYAGTGIAVTIAPLDLPGITDACYSFEVTNEGGQRVVARGGPVATDDAAVAGQGGDGGPAGLSGTLANPLCSTRFGNSQGALSYVAPCDASPGSEQHTVTLWVNSVCQDGDGATLFDPTTNPDGCQPLSGFVNPCGATGCAVTAQCVENSDTPVSINFTIMASAQQGFFDIGVNFDNIFCSAKVDCVDADGQPLELLHHPEGGGRGQTAVLGLACSAGPGANDTVILRDPITITCGEEAWTLDPAQPEGMVYTDEDGDNPAPEGSPVWQYAVYAGQEALPCGASSCNKTYWNVAIGFDPEADDCRLTTTATAGSANSLPELSTPEASTWPFIAVDVPLTLSEGGLACTTHPLNGEVGGVTTAYTSVSSPLTFAFRFAPSDHECEDPHWSDVALLLPFDGTFSDLSPRPKSVTPGATAPSFSSTTALFGSGSVDMGSTATSFSVAGDPDFDFGGGDFTVEAWVYPRVGFAPATGWANIVGSAGYGNSAPSTTWRLYLNSSGRVHFVWNAGSIQNISSDVVLSVEAWQHIAATRSDGIVRVFHNGVAYDATTSHTTVNLSNGLSGLTSSTNYPYNGLIDDLRVTTGVARYVSDFAPPSQAHPVCSQESE